MPDEKAVPATGRDGDGTVPRLALRPKDAARAIGVGERKLWELTADRTSGIPHIRFGKVLLYPVKELERWLSEKTIGGSRS